ncbi:N-formylglutamate amidohydrolase [Mesorhizobium sp. M0115]|uniref:N-formylglutamate amidohydrolase n=1 Tax=Mesorhizobium sp. M0115 TaxID=2956883 RepID=UPI00333661F2
MLLPLAGFLAKGACPPFHSNQVEGDLFSRTTDMDSNAKAEVTSGKYREFKLADTDPPPHELVGGWLVGSFFLICEHAGRAIPACLADLGIEPSEMERHIAYDVGAEQVARKLSDALGAPLHIQRYSRLVIDCNRPIDAEDSIPEVSDGTKIPVNFDLPHVERKLRYEAIHRPYHQEVAAALDRLAATARAPIILTVHSFTPVLRHTGVQRTCELGLLFNRDDRFARLMLEEVQAAFPSIKVSLNEPYTVDDLGDYAIPVHGEQRGLPHVLLEIRNDLITDESGQARWADIVARTAQAAAAKLAAKGMWS